MSDAFRYPKILRDGELKAFNDNMTRLLGTPIFFTAPAKLFRPKATDEIGAVYEVISGLYVVYHDYGMRIFRTYRDFCKEQVLQVGFTKTDGISRKFPNGDTNHAFVAERVRLHCHDVDNLRGGFCHGYLPNAFESRKLANVMSHIVSGGIWPDDLAALTEVQARTLLNRLTDSSDKMFEYFERCAAVIADPADGGNLLSSWREELIDKVFNEQDKQYQNNYFDERIIQDIEYSVVSPKQKQPHQATIQGWLLSLKAPIRSGTLTAAHLFSTLETALHDLYDPPKAAAPSADSKSSYSGSSMMDILGPDTFKQLFGDE